MVTLVGGSGRKEPKETWVGEGVLFLNLVQRGRGLCVCWFTGLCLLPPCHVRK